MDLAEGVTRTPLDLSETLQLVADTIVESLGFEVAVINLVDDDDTALVVVAVSGPDEVRQLLLGRRQGHDGAGLGYLQRFPTLDVIKLDKAFVAGLGREPVSEHIVRSVVELARGCVLQLVTEGVESEAQAEALLALGVRHAQGYLFGRPAPIEELRQRQGDVAR